MRIVDGDMEGTCKIWDIFLIQVEIYIVNIGPCKFVVQILPRSITECLDINLNAGTKLFKTQVCNLSLVKKMSLFWSVDPVYIPRLKQWKWCILFQTPIRTKALESIKSMAFRYMNVFNYHWVCLQYCLQWIFIPVNGSSWSEK